MRVQRVLMPDGSESWTVLDLAAALAAAGRTTEAHRLAADTERIARSITTDDRQVQALGQVAQGRCRCRARRPLAQRHRKGTAARLGVHPGLEERVTLPDKRSREPCATIIPRERER